MKIRFNKPTALTAANYGKFVIKYRWITIVAILLMVVALSAGGRLLTISNDSRIYFSEDNPQLIAFEAIEKTYSEANTVLIGLAATEGSVFQIDTLTAIQTLTEQGWQIPYASRVDSLTNFSHSWAEGDELIVNDLVPETKSLSSSDLNYIKDVALSSPGLVNRLVAEDGHCLI